MGSPARSTRAGSWRWSGSGVAFDSWPALSLCIVPVAAALVQRIRVEEAALGEPSREYERSTSRLIPGLW